VGYREKGSYGSSVFWYASPYVGRVRFKTYNVQKPNRGTIMGALEDIFAQFKVEVPPTLSADIERAIDDSPEDIRVEGEWVLYSLQYPLSPRVTKTCTRCGNPFQSNYKGVACCSNQCVVAELREKFGLSWTPANRRRKEKWEVTTPAAIIPYEALRAMKKLVAQAEADLGKPIEIGVPVEAFVLPTSHVGKHSLVSPSTYGLPPLPESESEKASVPQQEYPSHNQEVSVLEDSTPKPLEEDLFSGLFSL